MEYPDFAVNRGVQAAGIFVVRDGSVSSGHWSTGAMHKIDFIQEEKLLCFSLGESKGISSMDDL